MTEDVPEFFNNDVANFFQDDVANFFKKDIKDFFTEDVNNFFVEGYGKAMNYFGFISDSGRSTFQERMDDFLSKY